MGWGQAIHPSSLERTFDGFLTFLPLQYISKKLKTFHPKVVKMRNWVDSTCSTSTIVPRWRNPINIRLSHHNIDGLSRVKPREETETRHLWLWVLFLLIVNSFLSLRYRVNAIGVFF